MSAGAAADEAILLAGIARGREQDLAEFYRRYHGRVYAFLLRKIGDAADAAEAANEVMMEVWRSAARFEGRSRPLTWVLGIAQHKAVDRVRRRPADRASGEALDAERLEDTNAGPRVVEVQGAGEAGEARSHHDHVRLRRAHDVLPSRWRSAPSSSGKRKR